MCSIDASCTQLLIPMRKYMWQIFHMKRVEPVLYQKMLHHVPDLQMFPANNSCSPKDML